MVRFVVALAAVVCLTVAVHAEEFRGYVRNVEGNSRIVVVSGNTERQLVLAPNVRVFTTTLQGRARRQQMVTMELPNGLASLQPNTQVFCRTEMRDGREVVTQIWLENGYNVGRRRR